MDGEIVKYVLDWLDNLGTSAYQSYYIGEQISALFNGFYALAAILIVVKTLHYIYVRTLKEAEEENWTDADFTDNVLLRWFIGGGFVIVLLLIGHFALKNLVLGMFAPDYLAVKSMARDVAMILSQGG